MKKLAKITSLLLVGVMVIGMAFTAIAAGSPSAGGQTDPKKVIYKSAKIAAGGGSLAEVTDEAVLASAVNQKSANQKAAANLETKDGKKVYVYQCVLFDVKGVKSGEVTVQLQSEGNFDVNQAKGKAAFVDHYNTATGQWERQKDENGNEQVSSIDDNGCLTFKFPSYSPVMVSVLSTSADNIKNMAVRKVNTNPQQVLTTDNKKSPKMGE